MLNSSFFASVPGLIALLAAVIASAYFGATMIAAFLLLALLLCAGACLWSRNVLEHAEVSIADGQSACHAGETLPITLKLRSHSFFPLIWLDAALPLGERPALIREGDDPERRVVLPYASAQAVLRERFVWLLWQQEIRCEETLLALCRGVTDLTRVSLQAGDGLGLAAQQRWAELKKPVRLCVYPRLVQVDVGPFLKLLSDAEAGARGQTEDVTLLKSSRPYQHGDPMKRINWRALAMSGRMEVNEYERITPGCIAFLIDLSSFRYEITVENAATKAGGVTRQVLVREEALESLLSVCASCIQALSERGLRFALILPGYGEREAEIIPPGTGETALTQAMEALAAIAYRGETARWPLDDIRRLRRRMGTAHLCAYADDPAEREMFAALGLARLRAIVCTQGEAAAQGECLQLRDLCPGAQEGGAA